MDNGLDSFPLLNLKIDFVLPVNLSITSNEPLLVVKKISNVPTKKPTGLIFFLFLKIN